MKRFLWLLPAAAVLVGAFLLPELLLNTRISRAEERTYTADASGARQSDGTALSPGERLAMLQDPNDVARYSYDLGVVPEDAEPRRNYFTELKRLRDNGLISAEFCDDLCDDEVTIFKTVLLNMERGESLSMYRVQYGDGSYTLVDAQSGKIVTIYVLLRNASSPEREIEALINWHRANYPNWAGYYGAEDAESYSVLDFAGDSVDENNYLYAQRFLLDGAELGFTVSYNDYAQVIMWRPNTMESVNRLLAGEYAAVSAGENAA